MTYRQEAKGEGEEMPNMVNPPTTWTANQTTARRCYAEIQHPANRCRACCLASECAEVQRELGRRAIAREIRESDRDSYTPEEAERWLR